ncbi:hypothetical protein [Amycolatopsis jejuensis]|uniref:hypothetical protein n=1 Tax=Amycolatopsis jejuensis TaxID=330084 RepID=UPI0005269E57|nr:hypothetical protein [Amycolatopsis jejuensis]
MKEAEADALAKAVVATTVQAEKTRQADAMARVVTGSVLAVGRGTTEDAGKAPLLAGRQLKVLAEQGSFAVDDSTGDKMIESLEGVVDALQARWDALQKLGNHPEMSQTPAARWVAGHMVATASDNQGLLTQLQAARDEFPTYVEAIKLAKKNYRERESGTRDTFKRLPDAGEPS